MTCSTYCKKRFRRPRMLHSPLSGDSIKLLGMIHEHASHFCILRILWLRGAE